jgi:hypothetical protein
VLFHAVIPLNAVVRMLEPHLRRYAHQTRRAVTKQLHDGIGDTFVSVEAESEI